MCGQRHSEFLQMWIQVYRVFALGVDIACITAAPFCLRDGQMCPG